MRFERSKFFLGEGFVANRDLPVKAKDRIFIKQGDLTSGGFHIRVECRLQ